MANPVADKLIDWQNDAQQNDSNSPTRTDIMSNGTDLSGEIRQLKSEMRGLSLDPLWTRYDGVDGVMQGTVWVPFPSQDGPQYVNDTTYTLTGDWTAIIAVGQRVRVTSGGVRSVATITSCVFNGADTTIIVDASIITLGMTSVEYSAIGAFGLFAETPNPTTAAPIGAAGGDLSGTYPDPTVAKITGLTVNGAPPANFSMLQYNNVSGQLDWGSVINALNDASDDDIVAEVKRAVWGIDATKGFITIPFRVPFTSPVRSRNLLVQWETKTVSDGLAAPGQGQADISFATAFTAGPYVVVANGMHPTDRKTFFSVYAKYGSYFTMQWETTTGFGENVTISYIAIGLSLDPVI